ncbi:MAG TPA: LysM peptidoglycan-binding domain-containing protein [Thiotrichaceae bacterium]|nr:LysM peptidoglycan-binding domain-containing protein [Thiotrichaceae bacterium]
MSLVFMALSACSSHIVTVAKEPLIDQPVAYDHSKRPSVIKKEVIKYPHTYQKKASNQIHPELQNGASDKREKTISPVKFKQVKSNRHSKIRLASYSPSAYRKKTPYHSKSLYKIRATWAQIHRGFRFKNYRYQPKVKQYISIFGKQSGYMGLLTQRSSNYLPTILQEVKRRGMPTEIALLPFVESGFKTHAYSHAHAAGMWQFIPGTARRYGLKVSKHYDARYNWRLSTNAALNYLTDLSRQFKGDWLLALAAYNCGERRVARAIARNKRRGLPVDFWHLELPKETRHYVPRLLAFKAIFSNPKAYGVNVASIPYNPQYRRISKIAKKKAVTHKVRSGETLYRIAKRYGVSINKIMQLNRLKSSHIQPGRRLKIAIKNKVNKYIRG